MPGGVFGVDTAPVAGRVSQSRGGDRRRSPPRGAWLPKQCEFRQECHDVHIVHSYLDVERFRRPSDQRSCDFLSSRGPAPSEGRRPSMLAQAAPSNVRPARSAGPCSRQQTVRSSSQDACVASAWFCVQTSSKGHSTSNGPQFSGISETASFSPKAPASKTFLFWSHTLRSSLNTRRCFTVDRREHLRRIPKRTHIPGLKICFQLTNTHSARPQSFRTNAGGTGQDRRLSVVSVSAFLTRRVS